MRVEFTPGFARDLRRLRDDALRRRVERTIEELEAAASMSDVSGVGRLNTESGRSYRIRIGDYRLVMEVEGGVAVLTRFGHRRDVYRR